MLKFRQGEKYHFTVTVHSLRLSTSMPWHSTKPWYHDKARECSELPEWCSQVGVVWKRGNKEARTRWESALKIDQEDPVKLELITWDQSLSLPFTVYPKGQNHFKEKQCSVQLYARTGHGYDATGKKLASCKVDLGSVVQSKTVDLELLTDNKPLGLLRLTFSAKHVDDASPPGPPQPLPFVAHNRAHSQSAMERSVSDLSKASAENRVINNGKPRQVLKVSSWNGGRNMTPDLKAQIGLADSPEDSEDDAATAEHSDLRTPQRDAALATRSAPVSPRGQGSREPSCPGSSRPSSDFQEKGGNSSDIPESTTPSRGWLFSSRSFSNTPVTRSAAGSRSGSRHGTPPRGSRADSPTRCLGTVDEPHEEDRDMSMHGGDDRVGGEVMGPIQVLDVQSPVRRLDMPPPPEPLAAPGRSHSDVGSLPGVGGRSGGDAPAATPATRSIFNQIGDTFSSSFSVLGLGGRRASQSDASKIKKEEETTKAENESKDEAATATPLASNDVPFGKTNSELLKEVFALRREVVQCKAEMEKKDKEIAELRDNEADLKLRLVRSEACQKLPLAVTSTNTQKLIAEEAERLTSVYVPLLRELSDEVEVLKQQLSEKTEKEKLNGKKSSKLKK